MVDFQSISCRPLFGSGVSMIERKNNNFDFEPVEHLKIIGVQRGERGKGGR